MIKKEFTYRGKTMAELLQMDLEEFSKLVNSRQRRSLKKGFDSKVMKKIDKAMELKKEGKQLKPIRTHRRDIVIIPKMVGLLFGIHRGNEFQIVEINEKMLGHYLGEIALTRKRLMHGKAGIGATRSSTAITARG